MPQWYARILDQECGPMPFEDLVVLARQGTLRPGDRVRCEGGVWMAAGEVAGFFSAGNHEGHKEHEEDATTSLGVIGGSSSLSPHPRPLSRGGERRARRRAAVDARGWTLEIALLVVVGVLLLQLFPRIPLGLLSLLDVRSWSLVDFAVANGVFLGLVVAVRVVDALVPES